MITSLVPHRPVVEPQQGVAHECVVGLDKAVERDKARVAQGTHHLHKTCDDGSIGVRLLRAAAPRTAHLAVVRHDDAMIDIGMMGLVLFLQLLQLK